MTYPLRSISTPSSCNPSLSVTGRRPTDTSTLSTSSAPRSWPATLFQFTRTLPSLVTSAASATVWKRNFNPCFSSIRWSLPAISLSIPAKARSTNSSTSTSDPSRLHTDPSSTPM